MSHKYEKLRDKLKELFQLDQPDLDFGLYRVMHAKSVEVSQFLEEDLLSQVRDAFRRYKTADKAAIEKDLVTAIGQAEDLGVDPETSRKVKGLRTRLTSDAVDIGALESDVYDHLFRFFSRYYSEGDFLAKPVYKAGVYAIPYEGQEVTLHWANKDQHYIKTSQYLRDYSFCLTPEDATNSMRVHFRLTDAVEDEHGNVQVAQGKDRMFVLSPPGVSGHDFLTDEIGDQGRELVIRFEYRPPTLADWSDVDRDAKKKPPAQKYLSALASRRVLTTTGTRLDEWISELCKPHEMAGGRRANYTRLEAHLRRYTARNTFDFFIHKDLGTFLRRELDFYIKNEVMHLDDVENESAARVEEYLSKIQVIRKIAGKIIDFLAQLENFQKKLWLKKKFVVATHYCIAIGIIPEGFYPDIASNEAQHKEWVELFGITSIKPDLTTPGHSGHITPAFLRAHPTLVLDTRHFHPTFVAELLATFDNLDDPTDGILFHGDNFQSLVLMQRRYQGRVECVYIDPPYNTGDSEIPYKNNYLRSSWLTLMASRLALVPKILAADPVLFIAIDDFEMANLAKLVDSEHSSLRREMIIVNHHPQGGKAKTLSHTHEYMVACFAASSDRTLAGRMVDADVEFRPFKRSGTARSNFRYGRPNSFYAILIDPRSRKVVGIEAPPPLVQNDYPTGPTAEGQLRDLSNRR